MVRRENNNILHTFFTPFVSHTQFFRPLLLSRLLLKIDELSDNNSRVSRIFNYTKHLSISPYRTVSQADQKAESALQAGFFFN